VGTKNKTGRTVNLDEELREVFDKQRKNRKGVGKLTPYVFPNHDGKGKIKDFGKAWDKACQDARTGKRLFQDFRRTAVRHR
jgi:integrase